MRSPFAGAILLASAGRAMTVYHWQHTTREQTDGQAGKRATETTKETENEGRENVATTNDRGKERKRSDGKREWRSFVFPYRSSLSHQRLCVSVCMYTQPRLSSRASHVSSSRSVPNPSRARAVHDNAAYDRASTRERRGMCIRI